MHKWAQQIRSCRMWISYWNKYTDCKKHRSQLHCITEHKRLMWCKRPVNRRMYKLLFPEADMLNAKWQLINFFLSVEVRFSDDSAALSALTKHSSYPSIPTPRPLLTFVGPGLCGCLTSVDWQKKRRGGGLLRESHRLWWCACMCVCVRRECWLASADATQASAVSSHQLIPLPRSPSDPEVLCSLVWQGTFSMDGKGGTEAPLHLLASATSSLWHNRSAHTSLMQWVLQWWEPTHPSNTQYYCSFENVRIHGLNKSKHLRKMCDCYSNLT